MKTSAVSASRQQHGFAAVAAIFLVVGLAALGAFMVTFSNTQQITSAQDVQGSKAYWAARAGLGWALVAVPAAPGLCSSATLANVTPGAAPATVDGFTLQVRCSQNVYQEGGLSHTVFAIESQASLGTAGSVSRVERSLTATIEQ
jgi:MSHA biogenesis protein MshP